MERVNQILTGTLKNMGISKKFSAQSVLIHWREIVGEDIATHATPVSLFGLLLKVAVNNPVWSHHLMMLRQELVKKINQYTGETIVRDIIFFAGNPKNQKNFLEEEVMEDSIKLPMLTIAEKEQLAKMVEVVDNVNLRNKIFYAIIKQMSFNKLKKAKGWHPCHQCQVLCPPDREYCTVCGIEIKQERLASLYDLIKEWPWCGYQEIIKYVKCSREEFNATKKRMVMQLRRKVVDEKADNMLKATLVMLMKGKNPQDLLQQEIDQVIGEIKEKAGGKADVSAFGSRYGGTVKGSSGNF